MLCLGVSFFLRLGVGLCYVWGLGLSRLGVSFLTFRG